MVLGFKKQFVDKILSGTKIHTIREDKNNRWKKGLKMHMATGVRTKNYNQFAENICTGNRAIKIFPEARKVCITVNGHDDLFFNDAGIEILAKNDGFDTVEDFWNWFNKPFKGKIIYWTEKHY